MSDKEVSKKNNGAKKYLLPLLCVALLGGGSIWGISASRSADQSLEKTEESRSFNETDSDDSSRSIPDKQEAKNKKGKTTTKQNKTIEDVADSVLDSFDLNGRAEQSLKARTMLSSNELANFVAMVNEEEVEKKKEKERPLIDTDVPAPLPPLEPIIPTPEPEPAPIEPEKPTPELPWVAPSVNVVTGKAVVPVGGTFNPFDYMNVTYGSDQNVKITHTTIDTSVPGTQTLTMTAVDVKGYTASAELLVVINSRPILVVASDTVELQMDQVVNIRDYATAKDNEDGDLTDRITLDGRVDTSTEGTYDVTYSVMDRYEYATKKTIRFNVTNEAPVIHATDVTHEINQAFNPLESVTVSDREDGKVDLTEANIIENNVDNQVEGSYTVTIGNVKDSHGKPAENVTYTVNVVNEAPVIVVSPLELEEGSLFDKASYYTYISVTDREDDKSGLELTVTISEESLSQVDTSVQGNYKVLITVTDSMGKTTTATGIIAVTAKVTSPEAPVEEPTEETPNENTNGEDGQLTELPDGENENTIPEELEEDEFAPTEVEEVIDAELA